MPHRVDRLPPLKTVSTHIPDPLEGLPTSPRPFLLPNLKLLHLLTECSCDSHDSGMYGEEIGVGQWIPNGITSRYGKDKTCSNDWQQVRSRTLPFLFRSLVFLLLILLILIVPQFVHISTFLLVIIFHI